MEIVIFGRKGCGRCEGARRRAVWVLDRLGIAGHPVSVMDADSEDGAAQADGYDVHETPTFLLLDNEGDILARWDGHAPTSQELEEALRRQLARLRGGVARGGVRAGGLRA